MKKSFKNSLLLICLTIALAGISNYSVADSFVQSPYENMDYYELGMTALNKNDYNSAINYLKRAYAKDTSNPSIRNNIAVAYTARGNANYNKGINLEKAANDYRSAIYYLKYCNKSANTENMNENIEIAIGNLDDVLVKMNSKTDAQSRLKKAKELRGNGELVASVIEYVYASKDRTYAYESFVALGDIMKILSNEYNAAVFYDKALAVKSTDPMLHLKYGKALYNLGKIEPAVRELDIASNYDKTKSEALPILETIWVKRAESAPNDPIAQMNLGTVFQNEKKYDLALYQYKKAQALDPKNQMIRLNVATLLQDTGSYSEALEIYNSILKNKPDDVLVNSYKASTLSSMGKNDEAITIYKRLLEQNPTDKNIKNNLLTEIANINSVSGLSYMKDLALKMPNDASIQYEYAFLLHKNRNYNDALLYYQKSLALDEKNLDAYLNIASIYKQKNDSKNAINTLNKAKQIYPQNKKIAETLTEYNEENTFSLLEKASDLYNKKAYNEAIAVYSSIPNPSEDVYLGIGACYQALEKYDEAITNYNKAKNLDATNPNTHYFLGLAYFYKKDYLNAEKALKIASELDSVNPDIKDAIKSLKFAQSEIVMNTGIKLFEAGKNDDAIINFNKAINLCDENGYAYYYRALAYDAKENPIKAIADYKKAVELNNELSMAYYSIGLCYEALKNTTEAKKMYIKFLTEYKTQDEYYKYAKSRLAEL